MVGNTEEGTLGGFESFKDRFKGHLYETRKKVRSLLAPRFFDLGN